MLRALRTTSTSEPTHRRDTTTVPAAFLPLIGGGFDTVTDRTALGVPAFYRGLTLRTGILSTFPLVAETALDVELNTLPPILAQPDPTEDRQTTITKIEASLVLRGEAICVLGGFDEYGYPNVLTVINPDHATLDDKGWKIAGKAVSRDEILHIVSFALPGETRGCGAVELHRLTLEGEFRTQEYQRNFYQYGAQPSIVVTVNRPDVSVPELEALKASWTSKLRSRREPIVIPGDTSVAPLALSNRDSQFIEARQFALADIANIVGVPGYFLGAPGAAMTYSNVSDQRRDLLDLYLRNDLYAIERGFSTLLPAGVEAEFETDNFLRLDPRGTADVMETEGGWMTVDELRAKKNLPPLPDGAGAVLAVQARTPGSKPTSPGAPANV